MEQSDGKITTKTEAITRVNNTNKKIRDQKMITNLMNNYFYDIHTKLSSKIQKSHGTSLTLLNNNNPKTVFIYQAHTAEVLNIINWTMAIWLSNMCVYLVSVCSLLLFFK